MLQWVTEDTALVTVMVDSSFSIGMKQVCFIIKWKDRGGGGGEGEMSEGETDERGREMREGERDERGSDR